MEETGARTYKVGGVRKADLTMAPSAWDLDTYDPLLAVVKSRTQDSPGASLLEELLSPSVSTLQSLNADLSAKLSASPHSARLHEQAALLLGAWGLREEAEWFTDLRPLVCRMTAHLAVARALRDGESPSTDGKWAELLFDFHAGRRVQANSSLDKLNAADGPALAWSRAMTAYLQGDWRPLDGKEDLSPLELLAQFRALRIHVSADRAAALLQSHEDLQQFPDWSRVLLSYGPSVEHGHICRENALPLEFGEIDQIFPLGENAGSPEAQSVLVKSLNTSSPGGLYDSGGVAAIIHQGDWAYYFRRHLFHTFYRLNRFMLKSWGVAEAAREWEKELAPFYRELFGYAQCAPLLAARSSSFQAHLKKVPDSILANPEGITVRLWTSYKWSINGFETGLAMPDQNPWFRDAVPPETAYNARNRFPCDTTRGVEGLQEMLAHDPWNTAVAQALVGEAGRNSEVVEKVYRKVRNYSITALQELRQTQQGDTDALLKTLQQMSFLDPEYALDHGKLLAARGDDEAAARAFEHAFEHCGDRVAVSNASRWLIHYHRERGDLERATELASHNAEVYSARGLISALALSLDLKDRDRSVELAEALADRYDMNDYRGLVSWVIDGRDDTPDLKRLFPDGFRKVTLEEMEEGKVNKGLRITHTSELIHIPDLDYRDVILAVDGYKVDTYAQYMFLMDSTLNPEVTLIVRRTRPKVSYYERTMVLPNRRIDCNLKEVGK